MRGAYPLLLVIDLRVAANTTSQYPPETWTDFLFLPARPRGRVGENYLSRYLTETRALRTRTDAPMIEALAWLHDLGLEPDQPTEHQFKFGDVTSTHARTRCLSMAGSARRDETRLEALAAVLREWATSEDLPASSSPTRIRGAEPAGHCRCRRLWAASDQRGVAGMAAPDEGRLKPDHRAISRGPAHGLVMQ